MIFIALFITFFINSSNSLCIDPSVQNPFQLKGMLGGWRQLYTNGFTYWSIEQNTSCISALYGLNSNGTISVNNTAIVGHPQTSKKLNQIFGYAEPVKSEPAKLWVALQGVPTWAPLWWLKTSALNTTTGRYEWAIGSDPLCVNLFVLSRRWPLAPALQPGLDAALAQHSWKRKDLIEIQWNGCPSIKE